MIVGVELSARDGGRDPASHFARLRVVAAEARSAGFELLSPMPQQWVGESGGLQPIQMMSALAGDAQDVMLSTGPLLVAVTNPVDLAEQLATLDHASGGQLLVEVRLTARPSEVQHFGLDEAEVPGRTIEAIALWRRLWFDDVVDHSGRFYRVPGARPTLRPHGTESLKIAVVIDDPSQIPLVADLRVGLSFDADTISDRVTQCWIQSVRAKAPNPALIVCRIEVTSPTDLPSCLDMGAAAGCSHVVIQPRSSPDEIETFLRACGTALGRWREHRAW